VNHLWLVMQRELRETFRSRIYWVTMALLVAGVAAAIVVPRLLESDARYDLGLVGGAPAGIEDDLHSLAAAFDVDLDVVAFDDRTAAQRAVHDDDVDAALVFDPDRTTLLRRSGTSGTLTALAGQAAASASARERLVDAGLAPHVAADALATPPPTEVTVDDDQPGRSAVAYFVSLMLYMALFIGGVSVASGVAVEKSSRIAEVLVTTVRPSRLLAGKVLGAGTTTMLLLLAAAIPFSVAVAVGAVDVPTTTIGDVASGLGWFVLGYAIYATGFAALGALVDRQEDLGGAIGPLSASLVLSYLAAMQAQSAPGSVLARITSMFPLSSPVVMPVRIAEGAAHIGEVTVAVLLGLAAAVLLTRIGGTVYRRALLRGGRRLRLTEVLAG